jgi:hypothetical protein
MPTEKQIAASHANGRRRATLSLPMEKRRSAQSNTDRAPLARTVVLSGESRERFDAPLTFLHFAWALARFEKFHAARTREAVQTKGEG